MNKSLFLSAALLLSSLFTSAQTPRNQLTPRPPMGWMTWNLFQGNINEQLIRETADAMVEGGFRDAGYEYIFIDDLWQGGRDRQNNIIPDPEKFPNGIKALADYVHSKGLKLGIYSDAAQLTCGGWTASLGFEEQDARTFASWGIDYLSMITATLLRTAPQLVIVIVPWPMPCRIPVATSFSASASGDSVNARNGVRKLAVSFGVPPMTSAICGKTS